ncbi:hypothetical protein, partial [Staphylococcus capitis]|uniref:hypothetical protein n=1 Tax=Staphylococcus capitis TaxID=29388 RepID=UPI001C92DB86
IRLVVGMIGWMVGGLFGVVKGMGVVGGGAGGLGAGFGVAGGGVMGFGVMAGSGIKMVKDGSVQGTGERKK